MKDYYKINEIAKLYGIGVDSLRYYERLGILKPRRDTNGYRLYSLKEMYKLNMIRDLRRLNFSMEQIKAYLEGQTVDNTLHLLRQEADLVQEQLRELQAKAVLLEKRVATLEAARRVVPGGGRPENPSAPALRALHRAHHPGRGDGLRHEKASPPARGQDSGLRQPDFRGLPGHGGADGRYPQRV